MMKCAARPGPTLASPRQWIRLCLAFAVCTVIVHVQAEEAEGLFAEVTKRAGALADKAYEPPESPLPEALAEIGYDEYRAIRFRPEAALWRGDGRFEIQLFHAGYLYREPVQVNLVEDGQLSRVEFDPDFFRYDGPAAHLADLEASGLGFAGFRVHYPLHREDYYDEFLVFLGASYFRMVGRDQGYGLSARGLAIDTAESGGEEFPVFREFWLIRPAPEASRMTIIALLDSNSVTGAYRFDVMPGQDAELEVDARIFAREDVNKLGVAPLTSMFAFGDTSVRKPDDFRPRVHDSDGLLALTASGEWIWRPLTNPRHLRLSSLQDSKPGGFGLLQRERGFDQYLDLEARYDRRPGQWVEALEGDWDSGGVELVEIPTMTETEDNIVAFWSPDSPPGAGESRRFRYRTHTVGDALRDQRVARVVRTRQGWGAVPGDDSPPPREVRQFLVDFRGGELASLTDEQPLEADITTTAGEIRDLLLRPLPDGETWRATFRVHPDGEMPADMRLRLLLRERILTETWSYVWYPDELGREEQ